MIETPKQAARRLATQAIRDGYKPEALHEYQDAEGNILFHRIRLKHPNGENWIRPMYRNGHGYEIGEPEFPNGKPLYNLPQLVAHPNDPVWFVEGERCADHLVKLRVLSTTSGGSASAKHAEFTPLANRHVIIWPDNDEPGLTHAQEVAEKLIDLGGVVRLVDVAKLGLASKGDCVDWLEAHPGATGADLNALPLLDYAKAEAWPEPQPLIAETDAAPYPVDALPEGIRAAVREVVEFVQCPTSLAACSALSALSLACQGLADVQRADKLSGPCSLYLLAVADSGERKTTRDNLFTLSISEWEQEQKVRMESELSKHAAAMQAWTAKREGILQAIKQVAKANNSTSAKERELETLEANMPQEPRVPSLIYGDTTPEALAWHLAQGWPSGGVLSSEAGTVFGGHGMGRDSIMRNLALLNSLWDGIRHKVHRRTCRSADPPTKTCHTCE
jgi:hypothetical protein